MIAIAHAGKGELTPSAGDGERSPVLKIEKLDHFTITSADPAASIRFYTTVLGFELDVEWPEEITMLRHGDVLVAIAWWNRGKAREPQPAITVDHLAFRVDATTYKSARAHLASFGVEVDHESDHGINQSLYFRDPDGHELELACYELKGAAEKMPRPAPPASRRDEAQRAGAKLERAILFAKDLSKLKRFYCDCVGMNELSAQDGFVVLGSDGAELALHAIPAHIAARIIIEDPPVPREDTALKLVYAVRDLDRLRASAPRYGGAFKDVRTIGTTRCCDGVDPEGNVIQLQAIT